MRIEVDQFELEELIEMDVYSWPVSEHEEDKFEWYYEQTENCLILEGEATIISEFDNITIRAGDFVTFPKGLECIWDIHYPIKKHYMFE